MNLTDNETIEMGILYEEIDTAVHHCPYCGSKPLYPTKIEMRYKQKYEYPTTYVCGTVTSPNWNPPIRGELCKD